jgi:hypothetical protein
METNCFPIPSPNKCTTKEPRAAASNCKNRVRPSRKIQSLRVPQAKIIKAQSMLIEGHSMREVSRTLRMSGHTVAKVVRTEDFVRHIKEMQERLFAIAPVAIESFQAQVATGGYLAYAFLKDLQIIPTREALAQFVSASAPTESGYERQARLVAAAMLEARDRLGVELPEEAEEALAKNAQESVVAAATPARSASSSARVKWR